jgi:hypothetical protein
MEIREGRRPSAALASDGDDAAGRVVDGGGEAKNHRVLDGVRVQRGSNDLGYEVVVWGPRWSWEKEGVRGRPEVVEDWRRWRRAR